MRAIADAADVHARPQPDVFQRRERLYFALVINVFLAVAHIPKS
jgi:hypothetical protein